MQLFLGRINRRGTLIKNDFAGEDQQQLTRLTEHNFLVFAYLICCVVVFIQEPKAQHQDCMYATLS
jgi:hypothetical protein